MINIPILIFDWSGVMSDDRLPVYESNARLMERYGRTRMTFDEWLPQTTLTVREFFANLNITVDPEELFEKYRETFNQVRTEGIHPVVYPGTEEALQKLKKAGKKLIVISSHPEKNLHGEAKEYGIEKYFDFFIGNTKDKAETIREICKKIGVVPSSQTVAYTGDTIYDVQAAKKAGVYSIGITSGYHIKERLLTENPDKIISTIGDLLKLS